MTIDTSNRIYNVLAKVTLKRPSNNIYRKPIEDIVNWLHIQLNNRHTVFYNIIEPTEAEYNKPFEASLSFADEEIIHEIILHKEYDLYRGPEKIGSVEVLGK